MLVSGMVLAQYGQGDDLAEAHAMVSLVEQGWADQNDVARAFGRTERTVRRQQRRFEEGGLAALARPRGFPRGRARLSPSRRRLVQQLKAQGYGQREMARRIGVSEKAVRKPLRRLGWKASSPVQEKFSFSAFEEPSPSGPDMAPSASSISLQDADPKLSAFSASAAPRSLPITFDTDPSDRWTDRLLARLGLLEDAAPLFGSSRAVPRAGVLLALPVLVASGVFACAQQVYGTLGPAFYGLRTSILTLLLMALWRIKRPEGLKEHSPQDLGQVLGLDRAPEVKTLRRKLAGLAVAGRAAGCCRGRMRSTQHIVRLRQLRNPPRRGSAV